ncbi:Actin-binding protein anillin [Liparis tanakae]|uniref:Anillin n=1 Tax=Liparis tanakae TaxID=230148 RepID=A0A4Z2IBN4_9TELE|nr:Actin-binding protein anillin [Liparis tanakae]
MDPFTEKLLERTRARRENLQKKMAERPNAANRQMVKRPREPLADTNCVISAPVIDKVPQASSNPSPSKRRCSEENLSPAAGEENQEPVTTRAAIAMLSDPPTDKKPPVGPASVRPTPSLEKTATRPAVQPQRGPLKTPEPEKTTVTPAPSPPISREVEMEPASSALQSNKEDLVDVTAPPAAGMKSRLQRLAQQRKYWDGDDSSDEVPDCAPPSPLKKQAEVAVAVAPAVSSDTPVGRRGRLANLAATIGTWEDDLSHANIPTGTPKEKPVHKLAVRSAAVAASTKPGAAGHVVASSAASSRSTPSSQVQNLPAKPSRVLLPSPEEADVPAARPALMSGITPQKSSNQGVTFPSSPQKSAFPSSPQKSAFPSSPQKSAFPSSPQKSALQDKASPSSPQKGALQVKAVPSSPHKAGPSSLTSVPQSPLRNPALSRGLPSSPQKPGLRAKPTAAGASGPQEMATAAAPGVKSFLERFGERCQERTNQCSPAGGAAQSKTPTVTPSSVTTNTRLVQERLKASQAANTTTADLTQRQKLPAASVEAEVPRCAPQDEPTAPSAERMPTPPKCTRPDPVLMASPPTSTSSPLRVVVAAVEKTTDGTSEEEEEEVKEIEMNVDQSINSAVINDLFDRALGQSDDDDEEEEDPLNISSMSLLTPLAETVAAVVKSPERRLMTSTPASSFNVKSNPSGNVSRPSKFQRTNVTRTASSEALDDDLKLPYSIDAYRSTRVKEAERPVVKQVIVRNEDVSRRAEEPRGSGPSSIKQRMKILTTDMNLQQTIIHQASQALNCCTDEEHGRGSQVEAEAERLLLIATEKREALKAELDRLKGDPKGQKKASAAPELSSMSASKGSITLQEFRLPLKADFVCSIANKPVNQTLVLHDDSGWSGEHRGHAPRQHAPRPQWGHLGVPHQVHHVQKRDVCNDKKKKPNKSKAITPKRFLAITKSVQTPVMASPGGPNAVHTSRFVLVGSHKLTLSSIGMNKFPLEKVPFLCPLEGHVYLRMQCEVGSKVEEKGFLTMFDDVSGFGAWHRRWCVLSGYCISYWTYPDDEKRKNPIGRLNLSSCTSKKVEPVNREFCARPHTFELITVRPQRDDDRETLVSQCQDTMCVTKNWLSADTKDERNLWMSKLNQIVVDLRMWQPDSCYRPL